MYIVPPKSNLVNGPVEQFILHYASTADTHWTELFHDASRAVLDGRMAFRYITASPVVAEVSSEGASSIAKPFRTTDNDVQMRHLSVSYTFSGVIERDLEDRIYEADSLEILRGNPIATLLAQSYWKLMADLMYGLLESSSIASVGSNTEVESDIQTLQDAFAQLADAGSGSEFRPYIIARPSAYLRILRANHEMGQPFAVRLTRNAAITSAVMVLAGPSLQFAVTHPEYHREQNGLETVIAMHWYAGAAMLPGSSVALELA